MIYLFIFYLCTLLDLKRMCIANFMHKFSEPPKQSKVRKTERERMKKKIEKRQRTNHLHLECISHECVKHIQRMGYECKNKRNMNLSENVTIYHIFLSALLVSNTFFMFYKSINNHVKYCNESAICCFRCSWCLQI